MGNEKIKTYKDLQTWKSGHELVLQIYKITKQFPKEEQFGLVSQIRRASVSITSNIAEGFSRRLPKDKAHFYSIAKGSLTEVDNQILIAKDVGYIDDKDFNQIVKQIETVGRLLTGLLRATQYSKFNIQNSQQGFSLVEVILSSAVFVLLVTALVGASLYGQEATALAGNRARATMLAEEGLEAVRNIRDAGFANLINGSKGLAISGNQWVFSGANDATGIFTRQVVIAPVGADKNRKRIVSTVTWQQNPQRTGTVSLTSRLTNWLATNMASIFSANISAATIDGTDNTKVIGITIQNIGDASITVDKIKTVWSGAPGGTKLEEINIGGSTVWTGSDVSNKTQDISDIVLAVGASPTAINFFDFSNNMTGATLTLTFTMSDGTASTTPSFTP